MPPRLASGRGLVWCPDWLPGNQSGKLSRQLPRQLPRHPFQGVSGKLSGQLQNTVSQGSWKTPRNPKFGCFPGSLGNRGLEGSYRPRGGSRGPIPYSIYISQFQTGTPNPRYIGFRAGGRENGTRNGQFRPVFGHILRPLSGPSLFEQFRALERPRARFWEKS
jgi:hypothetical protein